MLTVSFKCCLRRLLVHLFFSLVLLSVSFAEAAPDNSEYQMFKDGLTLEKNLQIYRARDLFRKVIAEKTPNQGFLEHYAWFLHYNGFSEEAALVFLKALESDPANKDLLRGRAWNLKETGRLVEALKIYKKIYPELEVDRPLHEQHKLLAGKLSEENQISINNLKGRLEKNRSDSEAARDLMRNLGYQGHFQEAAQLAEKLLAGQPSDLVLRLDYARILWWDRRFDQAGAQYLLLLEKMPGNPFILLEYGRLKADEGRLVEAETLLLTAAAELPEEARIGRALAEVQARLGNYDKALRTVTAVGVSDEQRLDRMLAAARSRHFSGRLKEAVPLYQDGLKYYPHHPELLWGLAECTVLTGDYLKTRTALNGFKEAAFSDVRVSRLEQQLWKATAPRIDTRLQYYFNSSRFSRLNGGVTAELPVTPELLLGADAAVSSFRQDGYRSLTRESLGLKLKYALHQTLDLESTVGGNLYERGHDRPFASAKLSARPFTGLYASASWDRIDIIDTEPIFGNAIYNHVVTIGSVGSRLYSDEYGFYLQQDLLSGRLVLSGKLVLGEYSDNNQKQSRYAGLSYRILEKPGLEAGYQYFYLDYRKPATLYYEGALNTSAYYDPVNFEVHTGFVRLGHELMSGLKLNTEFRAAHIPKSDGMGYSVFGNLVWDVGPQSEIRIDGRYFYQNRGVERTGVSGIFRAVDMMIGYIFRF